jgi:hypothetical protein
MNIVARRSLKSKTIENMYRIFGTVSYFLAAGVWELSQLAQPAIR